MPKIEKTLPVPYGGISEQSVELMLDIQCTDMVNCIPDIVEGIQRRNGTEYAAMNATGLSDKIFHFYDRGEGNERYFMTVQSSATAPLRIFSIDGTEKKVSYDSPSAINKYLGGVADNLVAITVQDRTFIANKTVKVGITIADTPNANYDMPAYYWLSRSSNDTNAPYRYAVYLNGATYETTSNSSITAATQLAASINASGTFSATAIGSCIKIQSSAGYFTFNSWDSWGNQASFGWQGSVSKLSDLPNDFPFTNTIVKITGNDSNNFTDYYVIYDGKTWIETFSPRDNRGVFYNMPIAVDRLEDGTFYVQSLEWETNHVGDIDTNPTPSFVNNYINDIVFYKNRLGFSSGSAVTLSETGGYYNFFSKTVLEVVDDDPIDLNIPSGEASFIYYMIPYQKYLFLFTQYAQYVMTDGGNSFSPNNVSVDLISSIPMDTSVKPIRVNSSLYFVSKVGEDRRQLREYKYHDDTLIADGVNLSVQTPSLLPNIYSLCMDASLGYIVLVPQNDRRTLYVYKFLEQGDKKAQSAFFKFTFDFDIKKKVYIDSNNLYVFRDNGVNGFLLKIPLLTSSNTKVDVIDNIGTTKSYISSFTLPRWNVKIASGNVETALKNLIIKRLLLNGTGKFNVDIYRKDYKTTYTRTYDSNSTKDMAASILGNTASVEITVRGYGNEVFRLDSMILQGMYTQTAREVN